MLDGRPVYKATDELEPMVYSPPIRLLGIDPRIRLMGYGTTWLRKSGMTPNSNIVRLLTKNRTEGGWEHFAAKFIKA